jgi:esterase/lipase
MEKYLPLIGIGVFALILIITYVYSKWYKWAFRFTMFRQRWKLRKNKQIVQAIKKYEAEAIIQAEKDQKRIDKMLYKLNKQ